MSKPKDRKSVPGTSWSAVVEVKRKIVYWPNDCPECGSRMEFKHEPVRRSCVCGKELTAKQVLCAV